MCVDKCDVESDAPPSQYSMKYCSAPPLPLLSNPILPGRTNSLTQTIVACDLNNDHRLDLIVGNGFDVGGSEPNQILYNTGFN